jgi:Tfp pilus assembly protein FimT
MPTRIEKNNCGYTYLDLMLSIAIIGILSALSIITFSSYKHNSDVQMAILKLASDIRQTQNYALGLKRFNGNISEGGWGISLQTGINNKKYIIFADYNDGFGGLPDKIYNGNEKSLEVYIGQAQVNKITTIDNLSVVSVPAQVNITFEPPDPNVHICTDATHCSFLSAKIELKGSASSNSATSSVSVNNLGLVEVDR